MVWVRIWIPHSHLFVCTFLRFQRSVHYPHSSCSLYGIWLRGHKHVWCGNLLNQNSPNFFWLVCSGDYETLKQKTIYLYDNKYVKYSSMSENLLVSHQFSFLFVLLIIFYFVHSLGKSLQHHCRRGARYIVKWMVILFRYQEASLD